MEGDGEIPSEMIIESLTEQLVSLGDKEEGELDIVKCIKLFEEDQKKFLQRRL